MNENEQLMLFENEEVKIKTDKGETLINLANTARVCGITKIANSGNEIIKWKNGTKGIYGKLEKIRASLGCTEINEQKYIEEIDYILNEIEETDDRNSIFMSRYLTSRLAMECYSSKANEYKSWLAQLDEKYSNGELQNNNQLIQLNVLTNQINLVANTMTQIGQAFTGLEKYVRSSIQAKDHQIDEIRELVGFRSSNTKRMSNEIKDKLSEKLGKRIYATSQLYKDIKLDIFKEFKVTKWEEISVAKYHAVYAYLDELIDSKYNNSIVGGIQ
jgi:hypothetical protein